MKKILLLTLASALPLTSFLNQTNFTLQSQKLLNGEWIENEEIEKQKINAPQKLKNRTNIYSNKQIDIDLIENLSNKTIAQIYAKNPQKNYQLSLQNAHIYNQEMIKNFVVKKFYSEKTTEYFLPSNEYYSIFDTSNEDEGQLLDDAELGFRSSWGKTNGAEKDGRFMFRINEKTLKTHLILLQEKHWGKLTQRDIEIKTIKPTKLGLLPLVKVIEPPIGNAFWTTKKISFNDQTNFHKYFDQRQHLILPEGAGQGQEWWKWFISMIPTLLSTIALIIGIKSLVIKPHRITEILTVVWAIYEFVNAIFDQVKDLTSSKLIPQKIFEDKKDTEKIYNKIMENSFNLYGLKEIKWENLSANYLTTYIDGKLLGEAWSTAIFGQYSKMSLYTVWGAMNADIKYLVYRK